MLLLKIIKTIALASIVATAINKEPEDTILCEEYVQYCDEIGAIYDIQPELLMAIIETESRGQADADNGSCKGLMQVSERWHSSRMERLGVTDLYDAYGNILVGADYLNELISGSDNIYEALMIYHGERNIDGKVSRYAMDIVQRQHEIRLSRSEG